MGISFAELKKKLGPTADELWVMRETKGYEDLIGVGLTMKNYDFKNGKPVIEAMVLKEIPDLPKEMNGIEIIQKVTTMPEAL